MALRGENEAANGVNSERRRAALKARMGGMV